MTRFRHGLVAGRFHPPHAGHASVVRAAAATCTRVTVVACAGAGESIPLPLRVAWLREEHAGLPNVDVVGARDDRRPGRDDPRGWDAHAAVLRSAVVALAVARSLPRDAVEVDAVFGPDERGGQTAERLRARHVRVDPRRTAGPASSAAVRADPVRYWDDLGPAVRAWLTRRVVLVGADGPTTEALATALVGHYRRRGGAWARTARVPAYARELGARKLAALRAEAGRVGPAAAAADLPWSRGDFREIAREQAARERRAARDGSPLLVCESDVRATLLEEERRLGSASAELRAAARGGRPSLYLMIDGPEPAGDADGPGGPVPPRGRHRDRASRRGARAEDVSGASPAGEGWSRPTRERYRRALAATGVAVVDVAGSRRGRTATAVEACDAVLAAGWQLTTSAG